MSFFVYLEYKIYKYGNKHPFRQNMEGARG